MHGPDDDATAAADLGATEKGEIKQDQGPIRGYAAPEQQHRVNRHLTRDFRGGAGDAEERFFSEAWKRAAMGRSLVLDRLGVRGRSRNRPQAQSVTLDRRYEREFLRRLASEGVLEPEGGMAAWHASRSAAARVEELAAGSPSLPPGIAQEALAAAIQGRPDAGNLKGRAVAEIRALASDQARLVEYMATALPDRLRELRRARLSVDQTADVVIVAMQYLVERVRYLLWPLIPRLHGYLLTVPEAQRDNDWLMSVGSLSTVMAQGEVRLPNGDALDTSWLYAVYSNLLPAMMVARAPRLETSDRRILGVALNNLVVSGEKILGEVERRLGSGLDRDRFETARREHRRLLASGAGFEDEVDERSQQDPLAAELLEAMGFDATGEAVGSEAAFLASFEQWDKVGTTVPLDEHSPGRALFHLAAAVARTADRNAGQTAPGFFNVGVTLLRMKDRSVLPAREATAVRALINGLGLRWAVELNPSCVAALALGDGLDCAVNLFGSLAEHPPPRESELSGAGERLLQALQALNETHPFALDPQGLAMIEGSGRILGLRGSSDRENPDARFREALDAVMGELAALALPGEGGAAWPREPQAMSLWTARVAAGGLRRWVGEEAYGAALRSAAEVALGFTRDKAAAEATIRDIYAPIVAEADRSRPADPRFPHPTIRALDLPEVWHVWEVAQDASVAECDDLGAAVAEVVQRALTQGMAAAE